jgi:tRNA pseudouridine55 synthase
MTSLSIANENTCKGILLLNKPSKITSFGLVHFLRKQTKVKKIGHAGTLDPFATGLMIMLIGRDFTKLSQSFTNLDKEYLATIHLGQSTETYDPEGKILETSEYVPSLAEVESVLSTFQGEIEQVPPMYSAKRHQGKKLYELARKGISIERPPQTLHVKSTLLSYNYPNLTLRIACSKGTYIRSIAHDFGLKLGCFAYLRELKRERIGNFSIDQSYTMEYIEQHGVSSELTFSL